MITKINMINYEDKGGPQMSRLIEMIETAETIAVLGHIHPDGDCVGSCLAVCNYIREQYPEKVVQVYLEKPPVKFNYLKYFDEICQDAHTGKTYDLCICLDSAALDRLGEFAAYLDSAQASICLDHHVTNSGYAQENFVLEASSASEVVYGFLDLDKISKETAECIYTGILYVAYNINSIPMGMFSLTRQTKRKETFISGLIAGLLMVIPWFLSYFAMMCFYGDTSIVGADVTTPWMEMIKAVNGGPALMALFSLVMGWTLVETATGCIHMIIDRFDVAMEEKGAAKLSDTNRGMITVITLIAALVLSRVGVVTLIEQGYSYLSYGFILFYLLPTLLVGGYKIIKHKDK